MASMSDDERRKRDRERKAEVRATEKAAEYLGKLQGGQNLILREDYGSFTRWTWADRNGEWLKPAACQRLIANEQIHELRSAGNVTTFGPLC